jgi:hypothetical protein
MKKGWKNNVHIVLNYTNWNENFHKFASFFDSWNFANNGKHEKKLIFQIIVFVWHNLKTQ